jgi:succinate--hydroxymethylglutarate CoA-transferase
MLSRLSSKALRSNVWTTRSQVLDSSVRRAWLSGVPDGSLPLEGYRVLDMTRVLAGVCQNALFFPSHNKR